MGKFTKALSYDGVLGELLAIQVAKQITHNAISDILAIELYFALHFLNTLSEAERNERERENERKGRMMKGGGQRGKEVKRAES